MGTIVRVALFLHEIGIEGELRGHFQAVFFWGLSAASSSGQTALTFDHYLSGGGHRGQFLPKLHHFLSEEDRNGQFSSTFR